MKYGSSTLRLYSVESILHSQGLLECAVNDRDKKVKAWNSVQLKR